MLRHALALTCLIGLTTPSGAEPSAEFKIGFLATMSGQGGVTGPKTRDGLQMAIDLNGGKLGGLPTRVIIEDDQEKPEIARQAAEKFLLSDKVDVVIAAGFSNMLLAIAPMVTRANTILISANGGPSQLAGKDCSPWYFNTSWQTDTYAEAAGAYLQQQGVKTVYMLAPNYAAGRDVMTGFRRTYKGEIVGAKLTPMAQLDYSAELAELRAARPGALFAFYPGGLAIQFIKQFAQSGLADTIPLTTAHTLDSTALQAIGPAAIGQVYTSFWGAELDNPANKKFVTAWKAKYGVEPSEFSTQAYEAGLLLDGAIRELGGDISNKEKFRQAVEHANFDSVRGHFRFANDHYPIQNHYLIRVVKGETGQAELKLGEVVLHDYANSYTAECPLK